MSSLFGQDFERRLQTSVTEIKRILDSTKNPVLAGDAHHAYVDKYCLAEWLTNTGLAAVLNCWESLGIDQVSSLSFTFFVNLVSIKDN